MFAAIIAAIAKAAAAAAKAAGVAGKAVAGAAKGVAGAAKGVVGGLSQAVAPAAQAAAPVAGGAAKSGGLTLGSAMGGTSGSGMLGEAALQATQMIGEGGKAAAPVAKSIAGSGKNIATGFMGSMGGGGGGGSLSAPFNPQVEGMSGGMVNTRPNLTSGFNPGVTGMSGAKPQGMMGGLMNSKGGQKIQEMMKDGDKLGALGEVLSGSTVPPPPTVEDTVMQLEQPIMAQAVPTSLGGGVNPSASISAPRRGGSGAGGGLQMTPEMEELLRRTRRR